MDVETKEIKEEPEEDSERDTKDRDRKDRKDRKRKRSSSPQEERHKSPQPSHTDDEPDLKEAEVVLSWCKSTIADDVKLVDRIFFYFSFHFLFPLLSYKVTFEDTNFSIILLHREKKQVMAICIHFSLLLLLETNMYKIYTDIVYYLINEQCPSININAYR